MRISLSASAPAGGRSLIRLAIGLSALASTALAHPQPADAPPPPASINPTVLSVTEAGSGCPIGDGGMVSQMRNNTPVFRFMGWGLTLNGSAIPVVLPTSGNSTSPADGQDNHVVRGSVAKFCKETIALGNVPAGFQVHIGEVTVSGMATLDPETTIGIRINTRFDGKEAGVGFLLPLGCGHGPILTALTRTCREPAAPSRPPSSRPTAASSPRSCPTPSLGRRVSAPAAD